MLSPIAVELVGSNLFPLASKNSTFAPFSVYVYEINVLVSVTLILSTVNPSIFSFNL